MTYLKKYAVRRLFDCKSIRENVCNPSERKTLVGSYELRVIIIIVTIMIIIEITVRHAPRVRSNHLSSLLCSVVVIHDVNKTKLMLNNYTAVLNMRFYSRHF